MRTIPIVYKKGLLLSFVIFSLTINGFSQQISNSDVGHWKHRSVEDSIANIIPLFEQAANDYIQEEPFSVKYYLSTLIRLFEQPLNEVALMNASNESNERHLALIDLKQQVLRNDYGVQLKGSYLENFKEGIFSEGDIFYKRRGRFELSWDLLKNGLFEHRHEANLLAFKKEKIAKAITINNKKQDYNLRYNLFIYYFNKARIRVILDYLDLQSQVTAADAKLYALHYISWNEILKSVTYKSRLLNKLKAYKVYNLQFDSSAISSINTATLPVVDVQLKKMIGDETPGVYKGYRMQENAEAYNPLYEIDLNVFTRYSLYGTNGLGTSYVPVPIDNFGGREYFSAGVNVSVPIAFNASRKRKIADLEKRMALNSEFKKRETKTKEVYNHYYEYEFTIQQFIQFYGKYLNNQEEIRKQTALKATDKTAYSPRKLSDLLATRYEIALALIDLKQKLYLKLLKISQYTNTPITDYIKPIDLYLYEENSNQSIKSELLGFNNDGPEKPNESQSFQNSIYVWSAGFEKFNNTQLIQFLKSHFITTVYLSFKDTQYEKAKDFVSEAHNNGISVYLLVGNNHLIFIQNRQDKLRLYFENAEKLSMDGVNLDVEPQVFDDWDAKKVGYKQDYLSLIKKANQYATSHGLTLIASIPHYFDDILNNIKPNVSKVCVMIYETRDKNQIISRINDELNILGGKVILAIRPSDFENVTTMQKTLFDIKKQTGISQFAYHDLQDFKKSLKKKLTPHEK